MFERLEDDHGISICYENLGDTYMQMGEIRQVYYIYIYIYIYIYNMLLTQKQYNSWARPSATPACRWVRYHIYSEWTRCWTTLSHAYAKSRPFGSRTNTRRWARCARGREGDGEKDGARGGEGEGEGEGEWESGRAREWRGSESARWWMRECECEMVCGRGRESAG